MSRGNSPESIDQRVIAIIARELVIDRLRVIASASLSDDLDADSLDAVEIAMALEDEFDIQISDEAAEKITTVQHAIDYVAHAINSTRGLRDA